LECCRLSMRKPRLNAPLWEGPVSIASAYQEKRNFGIANTVTNRCYLLTFTELADVRQPKELRRRRHSPRFPITHGTRVHQGNGRGKSTAWFRGSPGILLHTCGEANPRHKIALSPAGQWVRCLWKTYF